MTNEDERLTYTIPEAAHVLGLGRNTTYALAASGKLPVLRLGKRLLIPKAGLMSLLDQASKTAA